MVVKWSLVIVIHLDSEYNTKQGGYTKLYIIILIYMKRYDNAQFSMTPLLGADSK